MKIIYYNILGMKVFLVFLTFFLVTSCGFHNKKVVEYNKFPKEYCLSADSVSTKAIYDNVFVDFTDNMLIVSSFKADTMLHFYSAPSLNYEFCSGVRGRSSNEIQSFPSFCHTTTNNLYVRGFTETSIRKFSISGNELNEQGRYKLFLSEVPNDMYIVKDSLLYYNDLTNMEVKSYNILKQKYCSKWRLSDLYNNSRDALIGNLCVNDSLTIYAFQYKREIIILRTSDLSYIKTVKWDYDNQDDIIETPNVLKTLFYTYGISTANYFYLLYRGSKPNEKNPHFCIEVYDKTVTPICSYRLDRKIFKFVVDENNGFIYGFGESDEHIYKYKLPAI